MNLNFDFDEQLEKLAKVPKAGRIAAVVGVLMLVAVGFYFLSYEGDLDRLSGTRSRAQALQRQLNKVRAVSGNIGDFEQEVADLERKLETALLQLPNRKQFEDLLQDISTAGKKVGVEIKAIQRLKEQPHEFYAAVPFKIELEGSFHDIGRFFDRLSKLRRIVNVDSLRMKVLREDIRHTVIHVEGAASTYRFLDSASGSAARADAAGGDARA